MECVLFLCTADELASCEACWFWQTVYIQSNYSAVFSSYVTTIGTRGGTNIKPQDPGEPKEPFGLVPHPLLLLLASFTSLILCLSSSQFLFLWLSLCDSSLPFVIILSPLLSLLSFLASSCSPPFPYLHHSAPLQLFSLSLISWAPKSEISSLEPQLLPQTSTSCSVYSIILPG